jgi:hypothetical protein
MLIAVTLLKRLKHNILLRKKEASYFVALFIVLWLSGFTLWAVSLCIYGFFNFLSPKKSGVKPLSLKEIPYAYYRGHILNRKYLRIKYFWKFNFIKAYKKLPASQRIWQLPLLLVISFYNALSTRYIFISTVYYARCGIFFFIYGNIWGLYLMFGLFLPLLIVTFLCGRPYISTRLSETYGKNTLKKLGFNILKQFATVHGIRVGGTLAVGVVGIGGYEQGNTKLCDRIADARDAADLRSYHAACAARKAAINGNPDIDLATLGPEPQFPSFAESLKRREEIHQKRVLPDIFSFIRIIDPKCKTPPGPS